MLLLLKANGKREGKLKGESVVSIVSLEVSRMEADAEKTMRPSKPHSLLMCCSDESLSLILPSFKKKKKTSSQNMHLLVIFSVLPSVTCKRHFHANISCKCSKCRLLPFSQTVAPLLPPQSQPPPFAFIQSFLASYFSPCSPPHTRSSIQPSQPPTHSPGMNRSEKRSHASSDARRSFWIRLPWMRRNFFFSLRRGPECCSK